MTTIVTAAATLSPEAAGFAARAIASAIAGNPDRMGAHPDLQMELRALRDALGECEIEAQDTGVGVNIRADFILI